MRRGLLLAMARRWASLPLSTPLPSPMIGPTTPQHMARRCCRTSHHHPSSSSQVGAHDNLSDCTEAAKELVSHLSGRTAVCPPPDDMIDVLFFEGESGEPTSHEEIDQDGDQVTTGSSGPPAEADVKWTSDDSLPRSARSCDSAASQELYQTMMASYLHGGGAASTGSQNSNVFLAGVRADEAAAAERPSSHLLLNHSPLDTAEELAEHVLADEDFSWTEQPVVPLNQDHRNESTSAEEDDTGSEAVGTFWWMNPPLATEPIRVPDKAGRVVSPECNQPAWARARDRKRGEDGQPPVGQPASRTAIVTIPAISQMVGKGHFLSQQDRLYLAPQTPEVLRLDRPPGYSRRCVMAVFAANDLRVHDNYVLALASVRARAAGLPVVAVLVLDYRTFAQPSPVGGFFRQGPLRAKFHLNNAAVLRTKLEEELRVPLLIRCGRPEEHVPRLSAELGAVDVVLTTQYAPHERRVHDAIMRRLRSGIWVSRRPLSGADLDGEGEEGGTTATADNADEELVLVEEHSSGHPYGAPHEAAAAAVPHSVWQTTLVHLDDLPTPVASMKEGERWYHDDVTTATIRPTEPYDAQIAQLKHLPQWIELLPSSDEVRGVAEPTPLRGRFPTLQELGYDEVACMADPEILIATQSSHPAAGEDAAITAVQKWLSEGGLMSMLRYNRERRTNTKLYSPHLSRASPYLSLGVLSTRKFYELIRIHTSQSLRDGFAQMQFREALLRLSRRDYWHWMGLRYGDRLFFSYGPHPEETDHTADWQHQMKIVQKWCAGMTGIPFADASMRELVSTGFVAHVGRQALAWLITQGYGQDWRLGAEWLERCSLDYDPFVCYGNFAYCSQLIHDDFGEPVRNIHYLAHQHDQSGIYVKRWLPQLSKVPLVYIHRPHVMTPRMQAMHQVLLGANYLYPLKLWDGAQHTLAAAHLPALFNDDDASSEAASPASTPLRSSYWKEMGYGEAARHSSGLLQPEEWHAAIRPAYVAARRWAVSLPSSAFADIQGEEEAVVRPAGRARSRSPQPTAATLPASAVAA